MLMRYLHDSVSATPARVLSYRVATPQALIAQASGAAPLPVVLLRWVSGSRSNEPLPSIVLLSHQKDPIMTLGAMTAILRVDHVTQAQL